MYLHRQTYGHTNNCTCFTIYYLYTPEDYVNNYDQITIRTYPSSVQRWNAFTVNASEIVIEDTAPRFDHLTYDFRASEEEDVRKALDMNVFRVLLTVIGDQQPPKIFQHASAMLGIKGRPDFILLAGDSLLFPIEVKTKWVLSEDDIVGK